MFLVECEKFKKENPDIKDMLSEQEIQDIAGKKFKYFWGNRTMVITTTIFFCLFHNFLNNIIFMILYAYMWSLRVQL